MSSERTVTAVLKVACDGARHGGNSKPYAPLALACGCGAPTAVAPTLRFGLPLKATQSRRKAMTS